MKRRNIIAAAAMVMTAMTFACTSDRTSGPKPGQELPAEIEGVERVGETLRTKPGFGWTKQPDGTFAARKVSETGGGDIIRVRCGCDTGSYACEAVLTRDDTIKCQTKGDCLSCKFFKPDVNDIK